MIDKRIAGRLSTLIERLRYIESFDTPTANVQFQIEALHWALAFIRSHYPEEYVEGERLRDVRARMYETRSAGAAP